MIELRGCNKLTKLDFKDIPLRKTIQINVPSKVREVIGLNLFNPTDMMFRGVTELTKVNEMWFKSNTEYGYWYYDGCKEPFETTFIGEIERIPTGEARYTANYLKGLKKMTEESKTSFVNALKDYSGQETATLYGASQYLSAGQIAIASAKNWTVT